jgi:hypothetical protein
MSQESMEIVKAAWGAVNRGDVDGPLSVHEDGLCVPLVVYPRAEIDEARAAAERLAQERG